MAGVCASRPEWWPKGSCLWEVLGEWTELEFPGYGVRARDAQRTPHSVGWSQGGGPWTGARVILSSITRVWHGTPMSLKSIKILTFQVILVNVYL